MRALHEVSINGIPGLGYAEVVGEAGQPDTCRGVIVFDEEIDVNTLESSIREKKESVSTGVVYTDARPHIATFPVEIRHFDHASDGEPGATFVGKAVPA